jgi:glucose-6-phosphate-specific signal transduction histidine kinase
VSKMVAVWDPRGAAVSYRCCSGGCAHAAPRRCTVRLHLDHDLYLSVTDDGHGLPATVVPGLGLSSMR